MRLVRTILFLMTILPPLAVAVGQVGDTPLVVPGTELGWESAKLELVLRVSEKTQVRLDVYSPGFDPNDYRSANELGDERYDGGDTPLKTVIRIFDDSGRVRLRREYGVEEHRWHKLIDGELSPGDYLIEMQFYGNGKNALAFKLTADSGKARLQVAPGSMQTYNVHGSEWQYPFSIEKRAWSAPITVGIYDGDGPEELLVRVRKPDGQDERIPTPGNGQWMRYQLKEAGDYSFGFSQPATARQYTNTVGFKVFLGEIKVSVVDESGNPVPGADYSITGYYDRTVFLGQIPEGWDLVAAKSEYGSKISDRRILFGPGGGTAVFVLRPQKGKLAITAEAVCGGSSWPVPARLHLGGTEVVLGENGTGEVSLPAGEYPVSADVPGADVTAPDRIIIEPGATASLKVVFHPRVLAELNLEQTSVSAGDEVVISARLTTDFPYEMPAELHLELPDGLTVQGNPAVTAPLGAGRAVTLVSRAVAGRAGSYAIRAVGSPCSASAEAALEVLEPARITIAKRAVADEVEVGGTARFVVRVSNNGQSPGRVRLVDELPAGLDGEGVDEYLLLQPGEVREVGVTGRVTEAAGSKLVNTAKVYDEQGELIDSASARITVLRPTLSLSRSLDKHVVVPGEQARICLRVENPGSVQVDYRLSDSYPDWLEPENEPSFEGRLDPGGSAEHCYLAKVSFGPETEGSFSARLTSTAGSLQADDTIKRVPLEISKIAEPQRVVVGGTSYFVVKITNPTDHPVSVRLLDTPARGLGMKPAEQEVELGPAESRQFRYQAVPEATGELVNKASVFVGDTPAAFPAKAVLTVLPRLEPSRISTIKLPFSVEGVGDSLLIAHQPPAGSEYQPGSSRLDGVPIGEPRRTGEGLLIWKVPYQSKGVLEYTVRHKAALGELAQPDLTLLAGDRELPLQGNVSLKDYLNAKLVSTESREGMIKEPRPGAVYSNASSTRLVVEAPYGDRVRVLVNGEPVSQDHLGEAKYDSAKNLQTLVYYGVPLQVGKNEIVVETAGARDEIEVFRAGKAVELVAIPEKAVADGRTPIKLRIESRDSQGLATGMGFVTVESSVEPLLADANLKESGYQVLLKNGVGELVLRPMVTPGQIEIKLAKDQLTADNRIYVPGPDASLWLVQGSITARYYGGLEVGGQARGYVETPVAGGTLQAALGVNASEDAGSFAYQPDLVNSGDPNDRFPLVGSSEESELPLESDDGVAVKYDRSNFSVGYYKTSLALPGISGLPNTTALVLKTRGDLETAAFAAIIPSTEVLDEIVPDGTRTYKLSYAVKPGSEKVVLRIGSEETELIALRDYVIDYPTGHITLARPLWPDEQGVVPVSLLVSYAPALAPRDTLIFGAGARYQAGPFGFALSAASLDRGASWKFGAEASFRTESFSLTITYGLDGGLSTVGLSATGKQGPVEAAGNLRYDGSLQGRIRVATEVGANGKIAVEHRGSETSNRSALLYEHRFGSLIGGIGAGYEWSTGTPTALARLGYQDERLRLRLTHEQSFSVAPSLSSLSADYVFDSNLKGEADLAYEWGVGISGSLGLKQKLGPANLSVSYFLPNASGGGNRARFGIAAPLPLSERVTLDLSAGYDRDLATGDYQAAAGAGIRYKTDDLTATLGVEGSLGSSGSKVTLRSGATGSLDERQSLSFDANYVIESYVHGRFTLAYSFRGRSLQVLTYHRMINDAGTSFEGELAPTWHPSTAFQLRPSAAYRVSLDDPGANLYQLGIGANYYFNSNFGLGGGAYYLWQPAMSSSAAAFSIEGSMRIMDPVWLNVGYTFGGLYGLTPEARPGLYLRLDFLYGNSADDRSGQGGEK